MQGLLAPDISLTYLSIKMSNYAAIQNKEKIYPGRQTLDH